MNTAKRMLSNKIIGNCLRCILGLFYEKKYLQGKFFEDHHAGYYWAFAGIIRSFRMRKYGVRWPVGKNTMISGGEQIEFDVNSLNVFQQPGCYYQAFSKLTIGRDVWIGPNVGIITTNHSINNPEEHDEGKPILISNYCWIGMNAVILPGVNLGENTVVGAGAVVTKSFPDGHCVIAGNPAKKIKDL